MLWTFQCLQTCILCSAPDGIPEAGGALSGPPVATPLLGAEQTQTAAFLAPGPMCFSLPDTQALTSTSYGGNRALTRKPPCSLSLQRATEMLRLGHQDQGCPLEVKTGNRFGVNSHHCHSQRSPHCDPHILIFVRRKGLSNGFKGCSGPTPRRKKPQAPARK